MYRHLIHPFPPIIGVRSEILILGSVPSVQSVARGFFYMHPQNRFWRVTGEILGRDLVGAPAEEKRRVLSENRIALYDAVTECDIEGSADAKAQNIVPTDLARLIADSPIRKILCNGTLSYAIASKNNPTVTVPFIKMPSTSPANAAVKYETLLRIWEKEMKSEK
jgi:hypoxanthine-DNA glycosylase